MGLNRRNKISAEFSMSSLTDIIFLLLIFFMLTSTLVRIDDFELPKSDSKTVAASSLMVSIDRDGQYKVQGQVVPRSGVERAIRQEVAQAEEKEDFTITIVAEVGSAFDHVVRVMEIAGRLRIKAIIATQPTE